VAEFILILGGESMNDSTASDSIFSHKDSVTISNNRPFVYGEAPEFKEPIIMNTPRYPPPINPEYLKLAQIAFDAVLQTMMEGEKVHGADKWKGVSKHDHKIRAGVHIMKSISHFETDNDIAHAMTRCAMVKYMEAEKQISDINSHEEVEP
jgi:hypothetical protein